jgi:hypothetical protein
MMHTELFFFIQNYTNNNGRNLVSILQKRTNKLSRTHPNIHDLALSNRLPTEKQRTTKKILR